MSLDVHQQSFTDAEWELILELLEREQKQLLVEIRHVDSSSFRQQLRLRLELVNSLLTRLQEVHTA